MVQILRICINVICNLILFVDAIEFGNDDSAIAKVEILNYTIYAMHR